MYAVYGARRAELRRAKEALGIRGELKLSLNAAVVLKERLPSQLAHQQEGEGTGFSFSRVRPAGDRVGSTGGAASKILNLRREATPDDCERGRMCPWTG